MGKHSDGTLAANKLRLDDTSHYHKVNSGMEVADVFHNLQDWFATVYHWIHQNYTASVLQELTSDVLIVVSVEEHGTWKGIVDTKSHRFPTCISGAINAWPMQKPISAHIVALGMWYQELLEANHVGQNSFARYHPARRCDFLSIGPATVASRIGVISNLVALVGSMNKMKIRKNKNRVDELMVCKFNSRKIYHYWTALRVPPHSLDSSFPCLVDQLPGRLPDDSIVKNQYQNSWLFTDGRIVPA